MKWLGMWGDVVAKTQEWLVVGVQGDGVVAAQGWWSVWGLWVVAGWA